MDEPHQAVWDGLNNGYGIEDIALANRMPQEDVRECVTHFRAAGKLPQLYGRAKKVWGKSDISV